MRHLLRLLLCSAALLLAACDGGSSAPDRPPAGPPSAPQPDRYALYKALLPPANTTERVLYWNGAMSAANAIDHVYGLPGEPVAADQLGPPRSSRAFAIVHIAIFDAINAVRQTYPSYSGIAPAPSGTSEDAAIAQAAHDALAALYPQQRSELDQLLAEDLARLPDSDAKTAGVAAGRRAAAAILVLRANDGADRPDPLVGVDYFPPTGPGKWQPDPVSQNRLALGAYWGQVRPFVLPSVELFTVAPPPALTSAQYTAAFNEVKRLGGDGVTTPTERTQEQTLTGIFWGYDGTAYIGTRPRQYNQLAVTIARQRTTDALEMARLLALMNAAIADSCMAAWYDKYGTDQIAFTFVSDELNGVNRDNQGKVRPLWPRSFASLTDAEQDNGVSRIYLGVHFRFDVDSGMALGRQVADYVFKRGLVPPDSCGCGGGK